VRAIKSGGGGLEPGVYFKRHEINCNGSYYQNWIWWNGELFCFRLPFNGDGTEYEVFKQADGKWTKIIERMNMGDGVSNPILFNGKLHFVSGTTHCVFDGASVTKLNNLPSGSNLSARSSTVYGGKLLAVDSEKLYEWDESADSWTQISTLDSSFQYNYIYLFAANGELYMIKGNDIYLYSNGTLTKVATFAVSFMRHIGFVNNCYYAYCGSKYDLVKYDPASNTQTVIGKWTHLGVTKTCFSDTPTPNPYFIMGSNNGLVCNEMIVVEDEG
jgi:hypothetical protein